MFEDNPLGVTPVILEPKFLTNLMIFYWNLVFETYFNECYTIVCSWNTFRGTPYRIYT